ncbi:MAG: hypothetical protein WDW38_006980 [Sanguina aurantia]
MPKPRAADRRHQEFVVEAWTTKAKSAGASGSAASAADHDTEFVDLIKPQASFPNACSSATATAPSSSDHAVVATTIPRPFPAASSSHDDTPWVQRPATSRKRQHQEEESELPSLPSQLPTQPRSRDPFLDDLLPSDPTSSTPLSNSPPYDHPQPNSSQNHTRTTNFTAISGPSRPDQSTCVIDPASERTDAQVALQDPRGCSGVCQLVLLPDGSISGHLVDTTSHRSYGIIGVPVASEEASSTCEYEAGEQVLRLTVINFSTLAEVCAVVSRRGGDLVRLQPAEPWQLRSYLNLVKHEDLEKAMEIQAHCHALLLLDGAAAEQRMRSNGMSKLCGQGGVFNTGTMSLEGLPSGFM